MRTLRFSKRIQLLLLTIVSLSILWRGGKSLDATLALSLFAGLITLFTLTEKRHDPANSSGANRLGRMLIVVAFAYVLWTVLSYAMSQTQNYGFDEVIRTAALFLLLSVTMEQAQRDPAFSGRFAKTIASVTLITCGIGIVVYCLQPVNRAVGTFFDWRFHTDYWANAWAQFLLLAWPLALWSLHQRDDRRKVRSVIQTGVMGLLFGLLLLSFSRGALITLVAQIFALLALTILLHGKTWQWKKSLLSGIMIAIVGIAVFSGTNSIRSRFHPVESAVKKATLSSDEGASSVTERVQFWQQAVALAQERPIVGWGPYSFRFIQPRLQTEVLATSDHPHNVFLKLAMERGFPAAALMLAIIVLAMIGGMKKIRDQRSNSSETVSKCSDAPTADNPKNALLTVCFLVSISGVLLHNLIDYNLQFTGISLPLWMMYGFLVTSSGSTTIKNDCAGRGIRVLTALVLLPTTLLCTWQLMQFSLARRAMIDGRNAEALTLFSSIRSPIFPRDDQLTEANLHLQMGRIAAAKESIHAYFNLNEEDARAWTLLASLQEQSGDRENALWSYRRAFELGRWNDVSITRRLVSFLHDDKTGLDRLRPEVDLLLKHFANAIDRNSHFIALSTNAEELVLLLHDLGSSYPSDAQRYLEIAQGVEAKASEVRLNTSARPQGILW